MRILTLVAVLFLALPATAQTWPERLTQTVSDNIDIIDRDTEARITRTLEQMREEQGIEMAVVAIDKLSDYDGGDDVGAFATELFNAWGIGSDTGDDGVLVLFVRDARELRVELGTAWPTGAQDAAKGVIEAYFVPDFRTGAYARGLESGTAELARRLAALDRTAADTGQTGDTTAGTTDSDQTATTQTPAAPTTETAQAEPTQGDGAPATPAGDQSGGAATQDANASTTTGATAQTESAPAPAGEEPATGSGLSWIWLVAVAVAGIVGFKLLSRPAKCPKCDKRGLTTVRKTIREATTASEGEELVTRDCPQCGYHAEETRALSKKSEPKSETAQSKPAPTAKTDDAKPKSGGGASGKW